MSTTDVNTASESTSELSNLDLKLEAVVIPVADVDRSKSFYQRLGWRPDADFQLRQRSPCRAVDTAGFRVVSDIQAARAELAGREAEVTEVFHPSAPGTPLPE